MTEMQDNLLSRLDERTKSIQSSIERINQDIQKNNETLNKKIENIEDDLKQNFVSQERFSPIQKIVYGLVAIILTTFLSSLVALVVYKP